MGFYLLICDLSIKKPLSKNYKILAHSFSLQPNTFVTREYYTYTISVTKLMIIKYYYNFTYL